MSGDFFSLIIRNMHSFIKKENTTTRCIKKEKIDDVVVMPAADWSEIHEDLFFLIIDQVRNYGTLDFIRVSAVCLEWKTLSTRNFKQLKLPGGFPVLMLPSHLDLDLDEEENDFDLPVPPPPGAGGGDQQQQQHYYYKRNRKWKGQNHGRRHKLTRSVYSIVEREANQGFQLPVPYYKNCRGSSHGWLITVDEEAQPDGTYTYPVRLLNPFRSFRNNQIQLPPLTPIPGEPPPADSYYLIKAFLSANPSSLSNVSDLLVLGMCVGYKFIFCRPGDQAWTYVKLEIISPTIQDFIWYQDRLLGVLQEGSLIELDPNHLQNTTPEYVAQCPPADKFHDHKIYLVEAGGNLFQIQRMKAADDNSTVGFKAFKFVKDDFDKDDDDDDDDDDDEEVFEMDEDVAGKCAKKKKKKKTKEDHEDEAEWAEVCHFDGHIVFLGVNTTISVSPADLSGCGSMKYSSIYFTDDDHDAYEVAPWDGPHDIGEYNLEDGAITFSSQPHLMPPPIWLLPML